MARNDDDAWLDAPPDGAISKAEIARLFGLAPKTLERWIRDGAPTHGAARTLTLVPAEVVSWLLSRDARDPLADAKLRRETAAAKITEAKARKLAGDLIDLSTVAKTIADNVARIQNELMTIPARLDVAPDVQNAVRAEIAAAITRLAEGIEHGK